MRPEDFSPGGIRRLDLDRRAASRASMRPEDFSPGGGKEGAGAAWLASAASMRPEDFSPGGVAAELTRLQGMALQ